MSKSKKTKKAKSDAVHAKKSVGLARTNPFARPGATSHSSQKINPFEIHVNKEKFKILGRTCKHDRGQPGVSRAKAVRKRQQTLGQEYRTQHKTNKFKDNRICKNGGTAELDENVLNARYVAEKMTQFKQKKISRFNLNDDEVLTHRGQTLEEIEQFHDDRSDDDDENNELNANFTEAANFGGDDVQQSDRQAAIEEMILETKRRKAEVAKDKDELYGLTEKLDKNYKEIIGLVNKMSKSEMKAKPPPDDYDRIMREMIFEPRGVVSDKLLSEEQLAKIEKERLEDLERQRVARMKADADHDKEEQNKPKHRSADDLDGGYFVNGDEVDDEVGPLAYDVHGKLTGKNRNGKSKEDDINVDENFSEEGQNNKQRYDQKSDDEETDNDEDGEANDHEEEETDTDDEEKETDDNLSDLKDSDSDEEANAQRVSRNIDNQEKSTSEPAKFIDSVDLPFIIDMPSSYQDFVKLIKPHTPENQSELVERIMKCNHPKLDNINREKVVRLFAFLMKYIEEIFLDTFSDNITLSFKIFAGLNPLLYDLIYMNPEQMSLIMLNCVQQKYDEFKKNPKSYPTFDVFSLLKLISNLFSTSDFRHPVVTPCVIFAQHILSKAQVRSRQDISQGLFLVTILLEYTHQSRRFLPSAINYLVGILYLAIPKRSVVYKILPPFQSTGALNKLLAIDELPEHVGVTEQLMSSEDFVTTPLTVDFKIRALNTAVKLINDAVEIASENIGAQYLAVPLLEMLDRIQFEFYPDYVKRNYDKTKQTLQEVIAKPMKKISPPERKPKALRLLEPRFEAVYDDKRRPKLTKEKEERAKLLHKIKRETKGAVREIRRDTEFLQKIRIQQQIKSDLERKEKVKRIFQEASVQQSELNELARAKKKKKF